MRSFNMIQLNIEPLVGASHEIEKLSAVGILIFAIIALYKFNREERKKYLLDLKDLKEDRKNSDEKKDALIEKMHNRIDAITDKNNKQSIEYIKLITEFKAEQEAKEKINEEKFRSLKEQENQRHLELITNLKELTELQKISSK